VGKHYAMTYGLDDSRGERARESVHVCVREKERAGTHKINNYD